jgi:hypothetical protein
MGGLLKLEQWKKDECTWKQNFNMKLKFEQFHLALSVFSIVGLLTVVD